MEEQKIIPLTEKLLKANHIAIVPIERMDWMRPQTEPYAVFSFKKGNRINKKPTSLIGLILKNRKTCIFAPEAPRFLTIETVELVNHFVHQINDCRIWYNFKSNKWCGVCAPKEDKE